MKTNIQTETDHPKNGDDLILAAMFLVFLLAACSLAEWLNSLGQ